MRTMSSVMRTPVHRVALALAALAATAAAAAQQTPPSERTTTWPDGSLKERWFADEREQKHGVHEQWTEAGVRVLRTVYVHGRRTGEHREWRTDGTPIRVETWLNDVLHGTAQTFHADGRVASSGMYRQGRRAGKWTDSDAAGERERIGEYRDGVLHGARRVLVHGKVASRQAWKHGELVVLDGIEPFPVPHERLLAGLRAILATPVPAPAADAKAPLRHAALSRLRAYRHLCGVPEAELELVDAWNDLCDSAAEVCRQNGKIDHHPPRPPGFDEARYRQGTEGASHSNLAVGGSLADSVDNYMDDSDPSNIERVGHRRWCLNPVLKKTGFGTDEQYHAMWSMDSSGSMPKGLDGVYYPPRGHVPVDMIGAQHAFSIATQRGGAHDPADLRATIRPLDDDWLPGEALADDVMHVAGGGFGTGACIVFRKKGLVVEAGRRYLVEVSTDGGKTLAHRYVVAFCEAAARS